MGRGKPRVWSASGQVDPLTGLAPFDHFRAALAAELVSGARLPVTVVVTEVQTSVDPVEHARRLTLAGAMARAAFRPALAVGRLGVRRVGVLCGRDADLHHRTALLERMVHDLPGAVRLAPVAGSPEVADWLLRELCR